MKNIFSTSIYFIIAFLCFVSCSQKPDPQKQETHAPDMAAEEKSIMDKSAAFQDAWNKADAKTLSTFYTDDALRIGAYGNVQNGKAEIEEAYNQIFQTTFPGSSIRQEEGTIRMLGSDYALKRGGFELTPAENQPVIKGHTVEIYKKVNGDWLIMESHPRFYPPPPDTLK